MILHANAALSRRQRERLVSVVAAGATITAAAVLVGCSRQTASKVVRFAGRHGIQVERVLTDNGKCFKRRWADSCDTHQIGVRKTRPYRPQTNGKAERFIRTLLERWAYAYPYTHETQRAALLPAAIDSYNRYRPHRALGGQTPLQRVNNLSGTNS
jgi:transposase InsO family protein